MEISKIEIVTKPTHLRSIIDDLYQSATKNVDPADIAFTCYIDPLIPEQLMLDGAKLEQALSHIINNATQFTQRGRIHIHVTLEDAKSSNQSQLVIIVADTGQGISERHLDQLFEAGINAGGDPENGKTGSGIGLAITRGLSRKMGGDVTVTSKQERGSEFKMVIPTSATPSSEGREDQELEIVTIAPENEFDLIELSEPSDHLTGGPTIPPKSKTADLQEVNPRNGFSRGPARSAASDIAPDQLQGLNIMIVEDIPANQEILRSLLEPVGCIVSCAGQGQEALDMMSTQIFDAILMDIRMPVLDGIQTTISIRKTPGPHQNIAIIALTADASAANNAECLAAGADVFLTKPVVVSELFSSIRYARRKQYRLSQEALSA